MLLVYMGHENSPDDELNIMQWFVFDLKSKKN